mmetsp:Transcript_15196/g.32803  ORF Transcript_15196/g.32803 Transcript_15196/m.32803 type:complete len:90 (-) Transcript_15196:238-507(-)
MWGFFICRSRTGWHHAAPSEGSLALSAPCGTCIVPSYYCFRAAGGGTPSTVSVDIHYVIVNIYSTTITLHVVVVWAVLQFCTLERVREK